MKKNKMKNNQFKSKILAGALVAGLCVPTFAQEATMVPIPVRNENVILISETLHWAQEDIQQLMKNQKVEKLFEQKGTDEKITEKEFQQVVQLLLDENYTGEPDALTREAVVYELMRIWAQQTGKNLDQMPVIRMLIYQDTDKIDAKYNHAITVAYMRKVARGRGMGLFVPKAEVTYGELAALVNNVQKAIKEEVGTGNEGIAKGKFETRASYEVKEDQVVFDFELMSHYEKSKTLMMSSGQQFEVTITNEKGEEVYRFSEGKAFTMALRYETIQPGETLKWQDVWDLKDKEGEQVPAGEYTAKIQIMVTDVEEGNMIEKDELTNTLTFTLGK